MHVTQRVRIKMIVCEEDAIVNIFFATLNIYNQHISHCTWQLHFHWDFTTTKGWRDRRAQAQLKKPLFFPAVTFATRWWMRWWTPDVLGAVVVVVQFFLERVRAQTALLTHWNSYDCVLWDSRWKYTRLWNGLHIYCARNHNLVMYCISLPAASVHYIIICQTTSIAKPFTCETVTKYSKEQNLFTTRAGLR